MFCGLSWLRGREREKKKKKKLKSEPVVVHCDIWMAFLSQSPTNPCKSSSGLQYVSPPNQSTHSNSTCNVYVALSSSPPNVLHRPGISRASRFPQIIVPCLLPSPERCKLITPGIPLFSWSFIPERLCTLRKHGTTGNDQSRLLLFIFLSLPFFLSTRVSTSFGIGSKEKTTWNLGLWRSERRTRRSEEADPVFYILITHTKHPPTLESGIYIIIWCF